MHLLFQLFVYLFAPICHNLKESDFQNFRLENGLKIWQAMWEFRHPDAICFSTHCKPKPKFLNGKCDKNKQFGDVFVGRKYKNELLIYMIFSSLITTIIKSDLHEGL